MLLAAATLGVGVFSGCQQTTIETAQSQAEDEAPAITEQSAPLPVAAPVAPTRSVTPAPPPATPRPAPTTPRPETTTQEAAWTAPPSTVSAPALASPPPPPPVTIPARTLLAVELQKNLSSHSSQVGESFQALLTQEVSVGGSLALPRGTVVHGRVTEATPAKKVGGRARLSLEFDSLQLPDGRQIPLQAIFAEAGKSQTTKDAAIIGGSTLGGAVIGHAVDKGEGTAIGAIVGGLAGAAIANETKGKPVVVNAGTSLILETLQPITVEPSR